MGGKAATQASNVGVVLWGGKGGGSSVGGGGVKLLHKPLM